MSSRTPDEPTGPDGTESPGSADDAFVRALLGEVGAEPEPLPGDLADRLDDVLAGLVAERAGTAAPAGTAAEARTPPAVVPLDRARQRRRRGLTALVAAAAVVVGGWSLTTGGLLSGAGTGADTAGSADSAGEASAPLAEGAGPGSGDAYAAGPSLSSGSLRADARRLVATAPSLTSLTAAKDQSQERSLDTPGGSVDSGAVVGGSAGRLAAPTTGPAAGPTAGCLDPSVPTRLVRLPVTYDGRAATAVVRPVRADASGRPRVRVEVWDCEAPVRLAAVLVRR